MPSRLFHCIVFVSLCRWTHVKHLTAGTAVLVLVLLAPAGPASAAWAPAESLNGPAFELGLVTSGEAGRVAVGGGTVDGALLAAARPPGGAFGAAIAAGAGSGDSPAALGRGGAISSQDGERPSIRRLRPDGSVSPAVPVGAATDTILGRPALAPSGALLVVATDETGDVVLYRQAADGQPAVQLADVNLPNDASIADVAATGTDQFVVALAAPGQNNAAGIRVRTITVNGTTAVTGASVETAEGSEYGVDELRVIPGAQPAVVYTFVSNAGVAVKLAGVTVPAPRELAAADGETSFLEGVRGVATDAGILVSWSLVTASVSTTGFAVLPTPAQAGCRGSIAFTAADSVNRNGPVLVGLVSGGAVGVAATDAFCAAPAPVLSAPVPDAEDVNAGVDADGTILALVGRGEAGASSVLAYDVTPPVLGAPAVPARVKRDQPFPASVEASDPWGLAGVSWSVDGRTVAQGASVTIDGLAVGRHSVAATGTNAAGLSVTREATVTSEEEAPPTTTAPPPPSGPAPQAPPAPAPSGPARQAPSAADTVAPVIKAVALRSSLFRPSAVLRSSALRAVPSVRGSGVRFSLSEDARVRLTLLRQMPSRDGRFRCGRAGAGGTRPCRSRCVGRARAGAGRTGRVLEITRDLRRGKNAIALTGRDATGRALARGRYRLSLRAADRAANLSEIAYVRFTLC